MDRKLLDRYARGECSEAERREVEQWLHGEDELPAGSPQPVHRGEEIWRQLEVRTSLSRRPRKLYTILGTAAAVLFVLFTSIYLFRKPASEAKWIVVDNPSGKQLTLTLPDSSVIHLTGGSSIAYPERFRREIRFIKGEAYFSVHGNPERPFLVNTPDSSRILVLGTEFNLRWPLQITLMTGKVAYQKGAGQQILLPGEQLTLVDGSVHKERIVHPERAGAWKDGVLWFDRTPINEVLAQIQRYYGITFSGMDAVEQQELSGKFKDQPLDQVLRIISQSTDIAFRRQGRNVTITKKSKTSHHHEFQ